MAESRYFTNEGLNKLKDELNQLMSVERKKISQQIAEARDKGDLSENAEYDAAKDAQGMLEMKISKLQAIVNNAKIIDESKLDASKVLILSTVEVKNKTNGVKMQYTLVPENEANLKEGKISVTSPIAQGLLGKKVGELATIKVPAGSVTLEIVKISRL
jgi:transcription elongation factor GreA